MNQPPEKLHGQKLSFKEKIKPWECPSCGQKRIASNKLECPKCDLPRPGTDADTLGQITVTYEGEKQMHHGIEHMQRHGWAVTSQSAYQPRAGLGRIALLGLGALVMKPNAKFVVTFSKVVNIPSFEGSSLEDPEV